MNGSTIKAPPKGEWVWKLPKLTITANIIEVFTITRYNVKPSTWIVSVFHHKHATR